MAFHLARQSVRKPSGKVIASVTFWEGQGCQRLGGYAPSTYRSLKVLGELCHATVTNQ
jgi:hypothetical protein